MSLSLRRRDFLKLLPASAALPLLPGYASAAQPDVDLLIVLNVFGAWDVASFCDPKLNTRGEPVINNWARSEGEIPKQGNIPYAPVWGNEELFSRHARDMLVINGVDHQTNSHTTGQIVAFSGRTSQGYPTLSALYSATYGADLALPYLSFGGYAGTGGLIVPAQGVSPNVIANDLTQTSLNSYGQPVFPPEVEQLLKEKRLARLQRLGDKKGLLPKRRRAIAEMTDSFEKLPELARFADFVPAQLAPDGDDTGPHPVFQQAQMAMVAYQAGLTVAADMVAEGNFDTHSNHDADHEPLMRGLNREIAFIWDMAEEMGIGDKVTLVICSDFARTPHYNGEAGKDHWPIGSYVVMKRGVNWTNRVVGWTDEVHNAAPLNPTTLQVDHRGGRSIFCADVHQALRSHLGLAGTHGARTFRFPEEVGFDFFNPTLSTPQLFS